MPRWPVIAPGSARVPPAFLPLASLSRAQHEVWRLVAHGLSRKQIGARLGLSDGGIRYHRTALARALGLSTAPALTICYWALVHGAPDHKPDWYPSLTRRERQCADLIGMRGYTQTDLARHLGLSVETARHPCERIYAKARVYSLPALICAYWGGEPEERRPVEEAVGTLGAIASRAPDWSAHMRYRTR